MANRTQELNTIGDLLSPVGATTIYKQDVPKEYEKNTITIKGIQDISSGLNNAYYSVTNTYQIMYFSDGYTSVAINSEIISEIFNDLLNLKVKVRGADDYITIQSWSMSAPFKTDTDGVYGVLGVLQIRSERDRKIIPGTKMQEVYGRVYKRGN